MTVPAMGSLTADQLITRRWAPGLPKSIDYYYEEDVPDLSRRSSSFPPDQMDLSDAWVVAIINSKLSREERGSRWPCIFTVKGLLRAQYIHKGQAAKTYGNKAKALKYVLLFGEHSMFGFEGYKYDLPPRRAAPISDANPVSLGLMGQSQTIRRQPLYFKSVRHALHRKIRPRGKVLRQYCSASGEKTNVYEVS